MLTIILKQSEKWPLRQNKFLKDNLRDYFIYLCANKFENLNEMGNFAKKYNLPNEP